MIPNGRQTYVLSHGADGPDFKYENGTCRTWRPYKKAGKPKVLELLHRLPTCIWKKRCTIFDTVKLETGILAFTHVPSGMNCESRCFGHPSGPASPGTGRRLFPWNRVPRGPTRRSTDDTENPSQDPKKLTCVYAGVGSMCSWKKKAKHKLANVMTNSRDNLQNWSILSCGVVMCILYGSVGSLPSATLHYS